VLTDAEWKVKKAANAAKLTELLKTDPDAAKSFNALKQSNLWNPDFFYKDTLERTASIGETGSLNGRLVFCLFLSYVILYFSAWKGVKSTGKMVWVTCTLPYVILTILFIKGLTLEGAGKGLKFLFIPEWSKLGEVKIW
jgi:SNF family Na+-dependent transporter